MQKLWEMFAPSQLEQKIPTGFLGSVRAALSVKILI